MINQTMEGVATQANSPLPRQRPSVSALGSRDCPLPEPNLVEHGLWQFAYDYATA